MEPARILHFIDTLGAGGAERQLVYLLENLDRSRFDCHVLTTYDRFRHFEPTLRELNIPVYSLHHGNLTAPDRAGALIRYVRLMWSLRPHIVHSWLHYPNLIARVSRPLCPPHRLITSIRSEYSARQRFSDGLTSWLSDFRIVNGTQTTSTHFKTNTIHIPNGVSIPTTINRTYSPNTFTTTMVARIDPRKDHLTLLNALHLLHDKLPEHFQMILIGEITDPTTQSQIDSAIAEFNLARIVRQCPPTHDITRYYAQADVTILPSTSEGFPNVILESFAASTPVIVSEAANSSGLVTHGVNGWIFCTGDSQALANRIETAWNTPTHQREEMGRNGCAIAEKYSILRMVEQYINLYERALSRS